MMEVQVTQALDGLRVSPPVELFRAPTVNATIERVAFWPSPDSQRFLYRWTSTISAAYQLLCGSLCSVAMRDMSAVADTVL